MPSLALKSEDILPFADLGTKIQCNTSSFNVIRNGSHLRINVAGEGYVLTTSNDEIKRFQSSQALLADPLFSDLSVVARNQALLLDPLRIGDNPVPVRAEMKPIAGEFPTFPIDQSPWKSLDAWLADLDKSRQSGSTDLILIDGPAGVGKTTIVRELSLLRAQNFCGELPLILQISSRGRMMQNISDLIAFALQDIRSGLTIMQLLVMMRHGSVILAIDGFDELSDPNGFETAWSGLNNLMKEARGNASFLLAGRETFVSTDIIQRQLKSFNDHKDRLASLSVSDPIPEDARDWLLSQPGWSHQLLKKEFVEPIFVESSYALRPFFLDLIRREPEALTSDAPPAPDLLSYLVQVMIQRESNKFIEALDPPDGEGAANIYGEYVCRFLEEIARDLAENQSDSISDDALDLLATVAADDIIPDDQLNAVVSRARTVVFLSNDIRAGHLRFSHEQLLQHFLAREAIRSIGEGETPRYIRRNLFGRESLDVFAHVAKGQEQAAHRFLSAANSLLLKPHRDRTSSNLAVLGVAAACAIDAIDAGLLIESVAINELHFPFSAPSGIRIRDTTISIIHAAGVDISQVQFEDGVHIATLEVDTNTRLPDAMAIPSLLVYPKGITSKKDEIELFIGGKFAEPSTVTLNWPNDFAELLSRIERYRSFWLRTNLDDTDSQGRRIISHPAWPDVFKALRELDLITLRSRRQASGTRSDFVHFRQDTKLTLNVDLYRTLMSFQ